jgi:hypothetical protein
VAERRPQCLVLALLALLSGNRRALAHRRRALHSNSLLLLAVRLGSELSLGINRKMVDANHCWRFASLIAHPIAKM